MARDNLSGESERTKGKRMLSRQICEIEKRQKDKTNNPLVKYDPEAVFASLKTEFGVAAVTPEMQETYCRLYYEFAFADFELREYIRKAKATADYIKSKQDDLNKLETLFTEIAYNSSKYVERRRNWLKKLIVWKNDTTNVKSKQSRNG